MQIKRVKLEGVTVHDSTEIEFPDRGIVLFSGKNGSGKTTIAEAVPMAVWGRTIKDRGQPIWSANKGGKIELEANGRTYTRRQTGRVKLSFSGGKDYETTTHAQREVNSHFGEFATWKRSAVLSSQESAGFCGATDAEKKRILEALTHSEALADAAEIAAKKSKERRESWTEKDKQAAIEEARLDAAKRALRESVPSESELEDVEEYDPRAHKIALTEKEKARDELDIASESLISAREEMAALNIDRKRVEKDRDKITAGQCGACGQDITEGMAHAHSLDIETALGAIEARAKQTLGRGKEAKATHAQALEKYEKASDKEREHDARRKNSETIERLKQAKKEEEERAKNAGEDYAKAQFALKEAERAKAEAARELDHVKTAHKILGPKGMRAHLVSRTIKALESSANSWLSRIGDKEIQLQMSAYGAKSDGSRKDEITISATIDGAEVSVKSASRGERRRIDIAICLALAELAEASSGAQRSTIFADEIFDGLTSAGISAVMGALSDLAEDRCVVVICPEAPHEVAKAANAHYIFEAGNARRL